MMEIAPGNWAILIKSFLMQIKQPLKACFAFPRPHYHIGSYQNQAFNIARLDPNQDIS